MRDRWSPQRAFAELLVISVLAVGAVRSADFFCEERTQECRPEPCTGCNLDVIYRSRTECQLSCSNSKSDLQSVWSCILPSEQGPCGDHSRRWHFDLKEGECRDFNYGGCLGNSNNFASLAECRSVCEYRITEILPQLNVTFVTRGEEPRCLLPRPDGICSNGDVGQLRFTYDFQQGMCRPFEWAGCEEKGNVFTSTLACQIQCEGIRPVFPVFPPPLPARSMLKHEMAEARQLKEMPPDEDHDPCTLLPDPGTCGANSPRLFYDATLGVCRRFLYGGCGGNLNNFNNLDTCYRTCNNETVADVEEVPNECKEPKKAGTCSSNVVRFYFDAESSRCRAFRYSGCDGSANNFPTLEACVSKCRPLDKDMPALDTEALVDAATEEQRLQEDQTGDDAADECSLPPAAGPCVVEETRWHYDPVIGRCRRFIYGGCDGNSNNFLTVQACMNSCSRRSNPKRQTAQCSGPPKEDRSARCFESIPRYTFSASTGRCERFLFDGCGATDNNFRTRQECERACSSSTSGGARAERVCQLKADPGRCEAQIDRYYYDARSGRCQRFIYGGCRGNANNFQTLRECITTCQNIIPPGGFEVSSPGGLVDCAAPPVDPRAPSCTASIRRFFYSVRDGRCMTLLYGGCGATDNNFATFESCERSCPPGIINETQVCLAEPAAVGDCLGRVVRFSYNPETGSCSDFDYSGCGGNDNNFASRRECLELCQGITGPETKDVCLLRPDEGPCTGRVQRYFYSADTGRCEPFSYGGCEGNGNNFNTAQECRTSCEGTAPKPTPKPEAAVVCQQRSLVGPCADSITRYYFDSFERRCQQFIYSGCGGNSNNFQTRAECERYCHEDGDASPEAPDDEACGLPPESGPCFAEIRKFYYDASTGSCRSFTYGGCSGNANNFDTLAECAQRCGSHSRQRPNRCFREPTTGDSSCGEARRSYYYSSDRGRCMTQVVADCGDSDNHFTSAAACREECSVPSAVREVCLLATDRGTCEDRQRLWSYSLQSGRCAMFQYGGCEGNNNRFGSLAECLSSCRGLRLGNVTGVPEVCLEPPVVGDRCQRRDGVAQMRWTFNAESMRCEEYESSGCEEGANMFRSRAECEVTCHSGGGSRPPADSRRCENEPRPIFGCSPSNLTTVYFFSPSRGICLSLIDNGCLRGENIHASREECLRTCAHGSGGSSESANVCRLPIQPGDTCRGRLRRYGFNTATGRCESFFYSGCDGNDNNFETLAACRERCSGSVIFPDDNEDAASPTEADSGPYTPPPFCNRPPRRLLGCRPSSAAEERFYWNRESRSCDAFGFRGCDVGDNMFTSRFSCLATCAPDEDNTRPEGGRPAFCRFEPQETRNCRPGERATKYYFSASSRTCRSFTSFGCERGRNLFSSRRECEQTCGDADKPEDEDDDEMEERQQFCLVEPEDIANCRPGDLETMYYFSTIAGRCLSFASFGCKRGRNMFFTLRECELACRLREGAPSVTTARPMSQPRFCRIEPEGIASCRPGAREIKYYFDTISNRCQSFPSVGCERGENMFFTSQECESTCGDRDAAADVCTMRPEPGPCTSFTRRWYHDPTTGRCNVFRYGGCGGNGNNFRSRGDCEQRCSSLNLAENEICNQPPESGERLCREERTRYYWDTSSGVCRSYLYSGCGATGNNFATLRDCTSACRRAGAEDSEGTASQQCLELPETKPEGAAGCGLQEKRYMFSSNLGYCVPFLYTGCPETSNNFLTRDECRSSCQPRNQCLKRAEAGRCDRRQARYAYDSRAGVCRRFTYSGCGGNSNRFRSERDCLLSCGRGPDVTSREVCLLPPVEDGSVNCGVREDRFFFDSALGRCATFIFTGCVPTENNFVTLVSCQERCQPEETRPERNQRDVCSLEKQSGVCTSRVLRYFYDSEERRCRPFVYSGCDGNGNNFETFSDCSDTCVPRLRGELQLDESAMKLEILELGLDVEDEEEEIKSRGVKTKRVVEEP